MNLQTYRTEALRRRIELLLHFPKYALGFVLLPAGSVLLLFGAAAVWFFVHEEALLAWFYVGYALVSALLSGGILGVYYLNRRITRDLYPLYYSSLETVQQIAEDSPEAAEASCSDWVQAVHRQVFLYELRDLLVGRLSVLGKGLAWLVERAFGRIERRLAQSEDRIPVSASEAAALARSMQGRLQPVIEAVRNGFLRPLRWVVVLVLMSNVWMLTTALMVILKGYTIL